MNKKAFLHSLKNLAVCIKIHFIRADGDENGCCIYLENVADNIINFDINNRSQCLWRDMIQYLKKTLDHTNVA